MYSFVGQEGPRCKGKPKQARGGRKVEQPYKEIQIITRYLVLVLVHSESIFQIMPLTKMGVLHLKRRNGKLNGSQPY